MQKWEYLFYESDTYHGIHPPNNETPHDKGKAGWELVNVVHLPEDTSKTGKESFVFYYKRPTE